MAAKEAENLRKITLKEIGVAPIDIEALLKKTGKRMDLADIIGIATKAKPGSSDYGDYVAFLGTFHAKRLEDGAEFTSRKIILPRFIEEELYGAFSDGATGNVEFAIRISVKYDADAATKYVYDMKPIIKPAESEQMAALMNRAKEGLKALTAPAK